METPPSAYPFDGLVTLPAMSLSAYRPEPVALLAPSRMTARDQDSAVGEEVCSGCGKPTRERGRLFFVDFGSATASFLLSAVGNFEAERDLRLRVGVGSATASLARSADFDAARDRLRVRASPRNPGRHLPVSVPLAASLPGALLPLAYDRAREPLLTSNGARNKPER